MKNKYIAAFFALTIFACSLTFASENFKMTTHAGFGILHGNIIEEVYSPECRNTGNMLSKLDWEVTAVPYFEAGASFDIFKYINIGIRGRVGIPVDSGNMQDYDWLNSTAKQSDYITGGSSSLIWSDQNPYELTNYSKSDNKCKDYRLFEFSAGGNIYLPLQFVLTPFISYEYELYEFEASGGYYHYKKLNSSSQTVWEDGTLNGRGISYKQEYNAFFIGVKASCSAVERFKFEGLLKISPCLTGITAIDYHYTRKLLFWDDMPFAFQLKAELKAVYSFTKQHSLGINAGLQWITDVKGPDYVRPIDKNGKLTSGSWSGSSALGGTNRFIWNWEIFYSFRF